MGAVGHRGAGRRGAATPATSRHRGPPATDRGGGVHRRRCARQSRRSSRSGRGASKRSTNARHRGMLRVILGEMREHQRFFEQAVGGPRRSPRPPPRRGGAAWRSHRLALGRRLTTAADPVAIALGSNLGDRASHLAFALERLRPVLDDLRVSRFIDTEPVGVGPQPDVPERRRRRPIDARPSSPARVPALPSNATAAGSGRFRSAPRTLDLDLDPLRRRHRHRARPDGAAPAVSRAAVRAGAAR